MRFFAPKTDVGPIPTALPASDTPCHGIVLQASPNNTATVRVGDKDHQPFELAPGQPTTLRVSNPSEVFVVSSAANQRVNWGVD